MKRENNIVSTKENPTENFSKELYPLEKEDQEIINLEKTCNILSTILKIEFVVTLIVIAFVFVFNEVSDNVKSQDDYKQASISTKID